MKQKQPASRYCFVCGRENPAGLKLDFYAISPQEITSEIKVPAEYQGYPGVVHGGIIAAMLDEIAGRVFMHGTPPRFMVTSKLSIRYRKPVPIEQTLKLIGHAGKDNGRVAFATGEIYNLHGDLLADAEAIYVNLPEDAVNSVNLDDLGWKVYPDEE